MNGYPSLVQYMFQRQKNSKERNGKRRIEDLSNLIKGVNK